MDTSKFNLWRACFSFCFIDGFLQPEEHAWIETKLKDLKFTPEQRELLLQDLKNPPAIPTILPLITKPSDRAFLVDQMRVISHLDKNLSIEEKAKIEKVRNEVLSKIDLPKLEKIIEEDERASYHEDEVYKVDNRHSVVERIISRLSKLLNPGDYKFPDQD